MDLPTHRTHDHGITLQLEGQLILVPYHRYLLHRPGFPPGHVEHSEVFTESEERCEPN